MFLLSAPNWILESPIINSGGNCVQFPRCMSCAPSCRVYGVVLWMVISKLLFANFMELFHRSAKSGDDKDGEFAIEGAWSANMPEGSVTAKCTSVKLASFSVFSTPNGSGQLYVVWELPKYGTSQENWMGGYCSKNWNSIHPSVPRSTPADTVAKMALVFGSIRSGGNFHCYQQRIR